MPQPPLHDFGLCIVCQQPLPGAQTGIAIGMDQSIPCCEACWLEIPAAQRLAIAAKWREAPVISAAIDVFRRLLERAESAEGGDSFDWFSRPN